jgi:hypothetical protein
MKISLIFKKLIYICNERFFVKQFKREHDNYINSVNENINILKDKLIIAFKANNQSEIEKIENKIKELKK